MHAFPLWAAPRREQNIALTAEVTAVPDMQIARRISLKGDEAQQQALCHVMLGKSSSSHQATKHGTATERRPAERVGSCGLKHCPYNRSIREKVAA